MINLHKQCHIYKTTFETITEIAIYWVYILFKAIILLSP